MRKYLFNMSVLGSITGAWSVLQATRRGPRDWRLALLWANWLISLALAVGSVSDEASDRRPKPRKISR